METRYHIAKTLQNACDFFLSSQKTARHNGSAESHLQQPALSNLVGNFDDSLELPSLDALAYMLRDCIEKKYFASAWKIYLLILAYGLESHEIFRDDLIFMFVECRSLSTAKTFLHRLSFNDPNAWMYILHLLIKCGEFQHVVSICEHFDLSFTVTDQHLYLSLLKTCGFAQCAYNGKKLHSEIMKQGFDLNSFIGSSLIDMYAKNGMLEEAQVVFDNLLIKDVVSWSALIYGYAENQCGEKAIGSFIDMNKKGITPNAVTFMSCLKACAFTGNIDKGQETYAEVLKESYENDFRVADVLVSMYMDCGYFEEAQDVFDALPVKDVVSWTTLIGGYAKKGNGTKALAYFQKMQVENIIPNAITCVCGLKACGNLGNEKEGRQLHINIIRKGFDRENIISTAVIDTYLDCNLLADAQSVFHKLPVKSLIVWNALITGLVDCKCGQEALDTFEIRQLQGLSPDAITFVSILKACIITGLVNEGRFVHTEIVKTGFERESFVGISLLSLYSKFGLVVDAQSVFDSLPAKDVVSWNTLIMCYAQHGYDEKALSLLREMDEKGVPIDVITAVCSLKACNNQAEISRGRWIHVQAVKQALVDEDDVIGSTLIDMYVRCNSLSDAQKVFDTLASKNVISWGTLLLGYARQGDHELAFSLFHEMQEQGVRPDAVSFLIVITLCNYAGLITKGLQILNSSSKEYAILPMLEHYNCMIDGLGRAGQLDEAFVILNEMPFQPNYVTWISLLQSCRKCGYVNFAKQAFDCAAVLTKDKNGLLVLICCNFAECCGQELEKLELELSHHTDDGE